MHSCKAKTPVVVYSVTYRSHLFSSVCKTFESANKEAQFKWGRAHSVFVLSRIKNGREEGHVAHILRASCSSPTCGVCVSIANRANLGASLRWSSTYQCYCDRVVCFTNSEQDQNNMLQLRMNIQAASASRIIGLSHMIPGILHMMYGYTLSELQTPCGRFW